MLTRDEVPLPLSGLLMNANGNAPLPIAICAEHLALLGVRWGPPSRGKGHIDPHAAGELALQSASVVGDGIDGSIDCTIYWGNPHQPLAQGNEVLIQALSGLMAVHGRDQRVPRRLGLEVASVAGGIVAAQGVLAALIGKSRGYQVQRVETSVLQGGLLLLCHHLAMATCTDEFALLSTGRAAGPPFRTADGYWVEIEVLTFDAWISFWRQLGVERGEAEEAWSDYVYRYLTASCSLPAALHEAVGHHSLEEVGRMASACQVALCRVRTYQELLAQLGGVGGSDLPREGFEMRPEIPWVICSGNTEQALRPGRYPVRDAPLAGLRVVEVTSRLQGPLAGLLLQQLGADVIKVEPPGGDMGRYGPPLAGSLGAAYLAYNRGKEVVEIDYKRAEGQAQIMDLVSQADVFLHNWSPGRAEKLGLDAADLMRVNPGLIYAHASGWGRTTNAPTRIAGDYLIQAYAALGDGLSPTNESPFPSRLTLVDVTGGLIACEGILAGLYLRERTGKGSRVDTSLLASAMAHQTHVLKAVADRQETGRYLGRPVWSPLDCPIKTADDFLVMTVVDDQTRQLLRGICGLGASVQGDLLDQLIVEQLRSRPAAEWELLLLEAGIPVTVVRNDLASLAHDPRVASLLERVNNACWVPAAPWQFKT